MALNDWASWLMSAQNDEPDPFPVDRALRFIRIESGGQPCATGRIVGQHVMEAGLAQTYFETPGSIVHGVTSGQLRALCGCVGTTGHGGDCTDHAKAIHAAVAMADMKQHRARARAKLAAAGLTLDETKPDFWKFVKLVHALPGVFSFLRPAVKETGPHLDWNGFKAWVKLQSPAQLAAIDHGTARYVGAFDRVWKNCEEFAG